MTRRAAVGFFTLALSLLLSSLPAAAQEPGKVYRIGLLSGGSAPTPSTPSLPIEAFRQGLRDLGYVEARNLVIEARYADGRHERYPDLVADLIRSRVDVIVTNATPIALAAKNATRTVPIVMAVSADPVGSGVIAGLARPGGNVTGLTLDAPEVTGKRLELLKETVPGLSRVALARVGSLASFPAVVDLVKENEVAAKALGLGLRVMDVGDGPGAWEAAFKVMAGERVQALSVIENPRFFAQRGEIVKLAARHRLPTIYPFREFVEAGGLMSYGADLTDMWRRAVVFVGKILKGARPADLPVEQPTKFNLIINLKTAKALGLTIPQSVLIRADEVIR